MTSRSIFQTEKVCLVCGRTSSLHRHHVYAGSMRRVSEREGFVCWLCPEHHIGQTGVHHNRALDVAIKQECQRAYERSHTRADFMRIIGKNYLGDGNESES